MRAAGGSGPPLSVSSWAYTLPEGIGTSIANKYPTDRRYVPTRSDGGNGKMIHLAREDVMRGLERFRSIAKQDFLASNLTNNPEFWAAQAAARREQYDRLIEAIQGTGVPGAVEQAMEWYNELPPLYEEPEFSQPDTRGKKQALEVFFKAVGIDRRTIRDARDQKAARM